MEIITKNYILEKLKEIMDNPELSVKDRLAALKMAGDYLRMFDHKIVDYNIRGLIAQLSSKDLEGMRNVRQLKSIEVEVMDGDSSTLPECSDDSV